MYCKTYRIGYTASNTAIHNSYSIHVIIWLYIHRYNISNTQIYICNARIHSTINSYKQYVYSYTNQQPMKRKPFLHRFFLPPNPYGSHETSMVTASQQAMAYIHTYIYIYRIYLARCWQYYPMALLQQLSGSQQGLHSYVP